MYWDNAQSQWEYASNGYASLIQQDGTNGGLYIATATSGTAGNLASWSKALTIDVDGNVGIGTDTPQAKLDIAGASSTPSTQPQAKSPSRVTHSTTSSTLLPQAKSEPVHTVVILTPSVTVPSSTDLT